MAAHPDPQTAPRDLHAALVAVQEAYDRLMAAPHPDPGLLLDLQHRTRELDAAAARHRTGAPHRRSERIQCRCAGATRGARWILEHSG
ncbi:hypothetical protein ACFVVX_27660 [Kitasatospora sp. NPDC058170]|uniref:hypothetical protein n=1 Tax=Kitasatospora sp. NPDC058170 TaxID=3346364 RepID=UPI0036DC0848